MGDKKRNYGIDLLRLVLMFMVCMLHVLGAGGILEACNIGTLNHKVYWLLEVVSYCAVDSFAIMSGYMSSNKSQKYEKIVDMWFQAFFYSFILTCILKIVCVNSNKWSGISLIDSALPVLYGYFWYFTVYFALFFAMPLLNKFLFEIDENSAKKAIIIIVVLFSVMGVISEPFKTNNGYSALWIMVLYCIGVLGKKIKIFETRKSLTLVIWFLGSVLLTWFTVEFFGKQRLVNYLSPTILLCAIIMIVLFSRFNFKGTVISKLSPLAFGIYLFHTNKVIFDVFLTNNLAFIADKKVIIGLLYVFGFAFLIFLSGLIVEFIRRGIAKLIGIPKLSKKIVCVIDKIITKFFVFLK